jgi:hypothetical protein
VLFHETTVSMCQTDGFRALQGLCAATPGSFTPF